MGFWSALKRGLGFGPPRTLETRRYRNQNNSGSFVTIEEGSQLGTLNGDIDGTHSGSMVLVPTSSAGPEEIHVQEHELLEEEPPKKPKKRRLFRRLTKKKRPAQSFDPVLPSTSELMEGAAPLPAPSTTDEHLRNSIREAMGLPPRPLSDTQTIASPPQSIGASAVRQIYPRSPSSSARVSPAAPFRSPLGAPRGSLQTVSQAPPSAPSPPMPRQTSPLTYIDASRSVAPSAAPSRTRGSTSRLLVQEVGDGGSDADARSIAALSYVTSRRKNARIYDIAEVIPDDRLSTVSEENVLPRAPRHPSNYAAIEQWADKHRTRLDGIDEKLQALKAEVLQQKIGRRYFSA